MKKFLLTLSITILISLFLDLQQSHARTVCGEECLAGKICDYYVAAYWTDQPTFDIVVLGSGNELVQLYCIFKKGYDPTITLVTNAIDKDSKIKVSNAPSTPKEKAEQNDTNNQKDTNKAIAEKDIAPGTNSSLKTEIATLTD